MNEKPKAKPKTIRPSVPDVRVSTGWRSHPKRILLQRRLGADGVVAVVDLWLYCGNDKPTGAEFRGMSDEEVEAAAQWRGESGALIAALVDIRLLDRTTSGLRVHDWKIWQPFARDSRERSLLASRAGKASAAKRKEVNGPLKSVQRSVDGPSTVRQPRPVPSRPVPSRPVPSRPDPTRPDPSESSPPPPSPDLTAREPEPERRPPDPFPDSPPDSSAPSGSGLGEVCLAWEHRQKTPLSGPPLVLVENLLETGFSAKHVIASFHAAADAVEAGRATSLRGAWETIATETREGGEYTWGRRENGRPLTNGQGERALTSREVLALREPT